MMVGRCLTRVLGLRADDVLNQRRTHKLRKGRGEGTRVACTEQSGYEHVEAGLNHLCPVQMLEGP